MDTSALHCPSQTRHSAGVGLRHPAAKKVPLAIQLTRRVKLVHDQALLRVVGPS